MSSNECIICLESGNTVYDVNTITLLTKTCSCDYRCHFRCITNWIRKEPRCLVCNSIVYLAETKTENHMALGTPLMHNQLLTAYPPLPPMQNANASVVYPMQPIEYIYHGSDENRTLAHGGGHDNAVVEGTIVGAADTGNVDAGSTDGEHTEEEDGAEDGEREAALENLAGQAGNAIWSCILVVMVILVLAAVVMAIAG